MSVGADQALGSHDLLSIGYVGSTGHRLFRREVGGPGNTPTALFALTTNDGVSEGPCTSCNQ